MAYLSQNLHSTSSNYVNEGASKRIEQTRNADENVWYDDLDTYKNRTYVDFTQTRQGDLVKPNAIADTTATQLEFTNKMQTYIKYYIAKIRLKDLSSFLAQSNLVRGSFLTLKFKP